MKLNFTTTREKIQLNYLLVLKQKLSEEDVKEIKRLHKKIARLYDKIEKTKDKAILQEIEDATMDLQRAWKFEPNKNYHEFWRIPGCECPKYDNEDLKGVDLAIYSQNCPWHGYELTEEQKKLESST